MTSAPPSKNEKIDARAPVTPDELSQALAVEVFDRKGKTTTLGELVKGKRTALVFIRHFWCVNCHGYVRYLSASMPPSSLPQNTQLVVIGCGSYQPVDTFIAASSSKYPVYTDPTNRVHAIFKFVWTLSESKEGEEKKDYMSDAGSAMYRRWGGIKYALGNIKQINTTGPYSLNGGEVVISADGECEFVHRMQNTVDHTNVSELASLLGAKFDESVKQDAPACPAEPGKA